VKDLVAGSGLSFEDHGTHLLEGVPDGWRLFRVRKRPPPTPSTPRSLRTAPHAGSAGALPSVAPERLTAREREVATLLTRGLSNRQIGEALVITTATAERHVTNVLTKLGFHSRAQIAAWAAKQDLQRTRFA
jgi:DNA-binding NarL/FixJ family response regulator